MKSYAIGEKAMDKTSKSSSPSRSGLKHRFAQMLLLHPSCATTEDTTKAATDLTYKLSRSTLQRQEPEHKSQCRSEDDLHEIRQPLSLLLSNDRHQHRVAAVEPLLPWTRREEKKTRKERRVTEIGDRYETGEREGRKCPPGSPSCPTTKCCYCSHHEDKKKKACGMTGSSRRKEARKLRSNNAYGFSSFSSLDCNDELGLFSSGEEEEESGTLFSSKSFSSDSSEFYCNNRRRRKKKSRSKSMKSTRRPPRRGNDPLGDSWNASNRIRPLASTFWTEEKKTEAETEAGYAVVKKSSDPYMDFRSSMVEMIVDRQLSSASDMESLLNSYLTLNSPFHQLVILEAFVDVWEAILSD